jgi:3-oxoacyl-[acyl-carrier-protein] synthase II
MSEVRSSRRVCVTGAGLLSPLGGDAQSRWTSLGDPAGRAGLIDHETYAPFYIYPIRDFDPAVQIPKPGDQRAMGPMMLYGVHAAGVALEQAGIKGDEALLEQTHMIVAAGGGERDWGLDEHIVQGLPGANDQGAFLNREMADGLRPTLFLAQLPNLFAGNISIVHGVSGSSRTFMGEESAGIDAVRIAHQKIVAGQGDLFLVGAGFNAERPDLHLMYHAAGLLLREGYAGLWRRPDAGICLGSAGAFLVLESEESARKRGVETLAYLSAVESTRTHRIPGAAAQAARTQFDRIAPHLGDGVVGLLSGACGAGRITAEEKGFLEALCAGRTDLFVRGTGEAVGHAVEAAFLQNIVLGLECLARSRLFPPLAADEPLERDADDRAVDQVIVTGWGHLKGEGMALLEKADG